MSDFTEKANLFNDFLATQCTPLTNNSVLPSAISFKYSVFLSLIYKNCINSGVFPDIWKRSHIISTYKKNDKCCINNYRPVSLLPICGKIFERILRNPLFLYLESVDVLTPHQLGFHPNGSCIYQLYLVG